MLRSIAIPIGLGLFLIQSGCGARATAVTANAQNNPYAVSGELIYLQRIALPPGSVAVVELRDVSIADAPAPLMAEERIDLMDRQVPVPFRLTVDRADLRGARRYSVRGAISGPDERLLWTTTEAHLIDPAAPGANLGTLLLSPVGPGGSVETIAARLQGAEWVVEDLNGRGIIDDSRGTLNFGTDGTLTGRSFCNTYRAGYTLSGENLTVSLLASTLMACAPALGEQETLFTSLLGGVQRVELDETGALILHSGAGTIKARRE